MASYVQGGNPNDPTKWGPGGEWRGNDPGAGLSDWFAANAPPAAGVPMAPGGALPAGAPTTPDMLGQLQSAPGYQFRLGEGLKALERSAAARGTLLTGGTLKGLQRFGQDYASGEYDKRFNQLYSLANLGMGAASGQATLGSQYANQVGNLYTGQGNVGAAGTIGAANAWGQGLTGAGNSAIQAYMLSKLFGGGTSPAVLPNYGGRYTAGLIGPAPALT